MTLPSPAMLRLFVTLVLTGVQPPAAHAESDWMLGEKLLQEHQCVVCHQSRVGGDGSAIYRPGERISTLGQLRAMVETCSVELNLALFPDEVQSIADVLNRNHYQFK